jgi:hypothetical protein
MARFNTAVKTGVRSPIATTTPATTALGGPGFERDPKSELFLLAVSNMANAGGAFHESGGERDARYTNLIRACAADTDWFLGFLGFLRDTANMRSASIIAAADAVKARLELGVTGNRDLISRALQRADEPGELLAYWTATYGRNVPSPVKRGVSDAVNRLFTERSFLKWDSDARGFRFADVLQVVHPKTDVGWRNDLYRFILNNRYQDATEIPETLSTVRARAELMAVPVDERRSVTAGQLAEAGMTWESLAGWLQGPMDAAAWESVIPSMGYMALLRNLRNFDQAGIGKSARREVEDKLTDPEQVAKSRQLPMRFLSAYRATRDSGTVTAWGPVIEQALNLSLGNVPELPGRTLVLVDLSGSMTYSNLSDRSGLTFKDAAAVFGAAVAKRCADADLVGFDTSLYPVDFKAADSLLPLADLIARSGGGGTNTAGAIQTAFNGHDRIVIITDEQAGGYGVDPVLKAAGVPSYTWNLAGYKVAHAQSGQRKQHTFGGLSDSAFRMIPLIEAGEHQTWPWV